MLSARNACVWPAKAHMCTVFSVCACASASAVSVPPRLFCFFRSQNREKAFCHMLVEGGKIGFGGRRDCDNRFVCRKCSQSREKAFCHMLVEGGKMGFGGAGTATIVWSAGNACFRRKPVRCVIYCCACLPGPLQEMMAPMLELLQGENVAAVRAALGL